jgi:hypothetical protein
MSGPRCEKFTGGWALPFSSSVAHLFERVELGLASARCGVGAWRAGTMFELGSYPRCKRCERLEQLAPKRAVAD